MSWIFFAFSGPILWAASVHIDKYLIEKYFKRTSVTVLMVFTALLGLLTLPIIWWFDRTVFAYPLKDIFVMIGSGVMYMGAMILYLKALQSEESSVVAPFFQASPVFGFVLGYFLLGERLTLPQLLGGISIFLGVMILSIQRSAKKTKIKKRLIGLMLLCALMLSVSSVVFKFYAIHEEYWSSTFWTFAGEGIVGMIILCVPAYWRQFVSMIQKNVGAVLAVNGANELINLGGGLGVRYAFLFAPLAIVQAISSTTTLFVFLIGIVLTVFLPKLGREDLSRNNLWRKGIAAMFIAFGAWLVGGV